MPYDFSQAETVTYSVINCGECEVRFALVSTHLDNLKKTGKLFHCPNGHKIRYSADKSDSERVKKLEQELGRERELRKNAQEGREIFRKSLERSERKLAATRGVVTKMKNRIKHGVCPCCSRQFKNLQRHMENKHPEFVGDISPELKEEKKNV